MARQAPILKPGELRQPLGLVRRVWGRAALQKFKMSGTKAPRRGSGNLLGMILWPWLHAHVVKS